MEYFEDIDVDALRHLRRAVSDIFLADNWPQLMLLGGSVSTEDVVDKVSTVRWNMVSGFQRCHPMVSPTVSLLDLFRLGSHE